MYFSKRLLKKIGLFFSLVCAAALLVILQPGRESVNTLAVPTAGKVVVIDPGHGGKDPGVVEKNAVEKDISLEAARKLKVFLDHAGAVAVLTRDYDTELKSTDKKNFRSWKAEDLYARIFLANERKADLFISIHVNSFKAGTGEHGAQVFSQPGNEKSKVLAELVQQELVNIMGNNHRKAKQLDYYILRKAEMPAAIVEVGFITNADERKMLQDHDCQGKIAYAVCSGIVEYFKTVE